MKQTTAEKLAPTGYTSAIIEACEISKDMEEDFDNEATTFVFYDDSRLRCCAQDHSAEVVGNK